MGRPSSPLFQSFVDTGETRSVSHTPSLARSLASAVPFACVSSQLLAELVSLPPVHPSVCFSTPVLRMCTPPLVEPHPPWVTLSRPPSKPSRTHGVSNRRGILRNVARQQTGRIWPCHVRQWRQV